MIDAIRAWKATWNPNVETAIGLLMFFGGYAFLQIIGSVIADHYDKKKEKKVK